MSKPYIKKQIFTKREISAELRRELRQYEASFDSLTPAERKDLHDWVAEGNSLHNNPGLLAQENGCPFCFIEGTRILADMQSNPDDYNFWSLNDYLDGQLTSVDF